MGISWNRFVASYAAGAVIPYADYAQSEAPQRTVDPAESLSFHVIVL
jgi:hypothetical protein